MAQQSYCGLFSDQNEADKIADHFKGRMGFHVSGPTQFAVSEMAHQLDNAATPTPLTAAGAWLVIATS